MLSGPVVVLPEPEVQATRARLAESLGWEGEPPGISGAVPVWRQVPHRRNPLLTDAEPATKWLAENDPDPAFAAYSKEMEAAAKCYGLTLDGLREAVSRGGRPSAEHKALRATVRLALLPMIEHGRNRKRMAEVLGCSRPTFYALVD